MFRLAFATLGILAFPVRVAAVRLSDYIPGYCSKSIYLYCDKDHTIVSAMTANLSAAVIGLIGAVAVIVFLYGAGRLIVSRGEEGKEVGKKAILYATLGLVLAVLAYTIIVFVRTVLYAIG